MDSVLVKRYLCAVCGGNIIFQRMIQHHHLGDVPDRSNCDLNRYSDKAITGGKLLKNKPPTDWIVVCGKESGNPPIVDGDTPIGGICSACLASDPTISALAKDKNIKFESVESASWRRY